MSKGLARRLLGKRPGERIFLWGATAAAIAYYLWVAWTRYLTGHFRFFDVGHIDSVLFNAFEPGLRFYSYHVGYNHFGCHFTPIFLPLAALRKLFPHPFLLVGLGDASIALGGAGAWLLARRETGSRTLAALFALFYWRNYWIVSIALASHFESLWIGPAMLALYFHRAGRWGWFWAWWLLAVSAKEDLALYTVGLGAWTAWLSDKRSRWHGFALMGFGLAHGLAAAATMAWVLSGAERSYYYAPRYWPPELAWGPVAMTSTELVASMGLLGLLHWRSLPLWMLPAAVCLLSKHQSQRDLVYYYSYGVAPFLFFNAILGAGRLLRLGRSRGTARRARVLLGALLAMLIYWQLAIPSRTDFDRHLPARPTPRQARLREMARAFFPPDARVMAQEHLYCLVPQRRGLVPVAPPAGLPTHVEFAPGLFESAEYVWLDASEPFGSVPADSIRAMVDILDQEAARGEAKRVYFEDSVIVFKRGLKPVRENAR